MGPMRKIDFSKLRIANGLNHTIIVEPFIQSIGEGNYPIFSNLHVDGVALHAFYFVRNLPQGLVLKVP